ncbi:hypothetical protein BT69DRAFT_1212813, partial [Atractiella rhizophila]
QCPTQDNYSDCGLFVLHFVELFLRDPDTILRLTSKVSLLLCRRFQLYLLCIEIRQ